MEQKYKDMISEVCKVKWLLIKFRNLIEITASAKPVYIDCTLQGYLYLILKQFAENCYQFSNLNWTLPWSSNYSFFIEKYGQLDSTFIVANQYYEIYTLMYVTNTYMYIHIYVYVYDTQILNAQLNSIHT